MPEAVVIYERRCLGEDPPTLTVEVERITPDLELVRLGGELDLAGSDFVAKRLCAVAGSTVVVDLQRLRFIDASGLSSLLTAKRRLEAAGHRLELRSATGIVRRVFDITGLAYLLEEADA